ncbi:hypothetical protein [Cohnella boryungensis]|uniref:DUF3040 domain-containing protein n=1 Tax=Cohnella boryungensis TaxID=768479 RepID=A0ABV8SEH5_9BACL
MKPTEREQAFLDEVYRKARELEYDRSQAEKVRRNTRLLARQRYAKAASVAAAAGAVFLMIRLGKIDQGLCVTLSLLLIGAGVTAERTEWLWSADKDKE